MVDFLEKLSDLSNYSFHLGISNATMQIQLSDDETVSSDDFLRILENGSPLHSITATRPIERTWLVTKNMIIRTYDECSRMIIEQNAQRILIEDKMRFAANLIKIMLQQFVDQRISDQITCQVFYKGRKIN